VTASILLPDGSHWDWLAPLRERRIRSVLDVGANVGGRIPTWKDLGAEWILAVEPVPDAFEKLCASTWHDPGIECVRCGVSDTPEIRHGLSVHGAWSLADAIGDGSPTDHTIGRALEYVGKPAFDVSFQTIDYLCESRGFGPDLVKIDVDGYDFQALRSARSLLSRRAPILMLELSFLPHVLLGDCCESGVMDLYGAGYRLQRITDGKLFSDARDVMRHYPWDTSWDVLGWPRGATP